MPVILKRTMLVLVYGLFTIAFGEAFVRMTDPQPLMPRYVEGMSWGVRGNIPGSTYRHVTPEVNVEYRINNAGMRDDREFEPPKSEGVCRIAMLGDSYFMGYEVALEDSIASLLERRIEEHGYNVDVLNFAVSGFGQAEMLRAYEQVVRPFEPDVVLTSWHRTDIDDIVRSQLYRVQDGLLVEDRLSYVPIDGWQQRLLTSPAGRFLSENSQFYALVREWAGRNGRSLLVFLRRLQNGTAFNSGVDVQAERPGEEDGLAANAARHYSDADIALATAVLRKLDADVKADGGRQVVLEIPGRISRIDFEPVFNSLPADAWKGIDTLSPLTALRDAAGPETKLYFEHGASHFTPEATNIVAGLVADHVVSLPELDGCKIP